MDPGGDIMLHGLRDGVRMEGDWTQGCIAVTDEEMDEIWLVGEGTAIWIGSEKTNLVDLCVFNDLLGSFGMLAMWVTWLGSFGSLGSLGSAPRPILL